MRETVAKRAKPKKSKTVMGKIKELALSKIATPKKKKKNAVLEGNLIAKEMVKPGRRGVNPEESADPAHAKGHRRLSLH